MAGETIQPGRTITSLCDHDLLLVHFRTRDEPAEVHAGRDLPPRIVVELPCCQMPAGSEALPQQRSHAAPAGVVQPDEHFAFACHIEHQCG